MKTGKKDGKPEAPPKLGNPDKSGITAGGKGPLKGPKPTLGPGITGKKW